MNPNLRTPTFLESACHIPKGIEWSLDVKGFKIHHLLASGGWIYKYSI